ncbi:MAG: hypothetical protein ACT4PO_05925 [Actinomycetota bacterium]
MTERAPIAVLYEHPEWFKPLFAELDRRGVPHDRIHAASHSFDPSERDSPYALVVNRMSPSAWLRGHGQAIFHTLHYLAHLDDIGAVPDRPGNDQRYAVDATRILEETGWCPRSSFKEALASTVDWYRNHVDWWLTRTHEIDRRRGLSAPDPAAER